MSEITVDQGQDPHSGNACWRIWCGEKQVDYSYEHIHQEGLVQWARDILEEYEGCYEYVLKVPSVKLRLDVAKRILGGEKVVFK